LIEIKTVATPKNKIHRVAQSIATETAFERPGEMEPVGTVQGEERKRGPHFYGRNYRKFLRGGSARREREKKR